MKAIYIVTLEGSEVFHNQSFEGCIESFRDLPIIRNMTTLLITEILNS